MIGAKRGFTLIELLVVIAIIAILMVTVVVTLNPGQLLAQSRDSNRLSDISALKSSLLLYTVDVATTTNLSGAKTTCYSTTALTGCGTWATSTTGAANNSSSRAIDKTGWIPVNFNAISAGAPFAQLPIDPLNTSSSNLAYTYNASGTALFKLDAHMESSKFQNGGSSDVCSTDGGYDPNSFEAGTGMLSL